MDPRRKKIYIGLIVTCFALSAAILGWGFFSTPDNAMQSPQAVFVNQDAGGDSFSGFLAPSVFPVSDKFNTEVLETSAFRKLQPYQPADVTGQLGRPDPFRNY